VSKELRKAAAMMAARMRFFKRTADNARDMKTNVDLAPQEFWEPGDQAALDAYEAAINHSQGLEPLPFPQAAATATTQEVLH